MNTTTADAGSATTADQSAARRLRRSGDEKMLAGVALYVAAWLLIPADGEDRPAAGAWIAGRRDRSR